MFGRLDFLLVDVFELSVALIPSLYWGLHSFLGPYQYVGPSVGGAFQDKSTKNFEN